MHAQICPGLPYCATIFIFRDNEKETYCCLEDRTRALHILSPTFIGTEQVFPPEHKTDGRNQRFTSYLVLPSSSKPKHNLLKIKAKGSGFFFRNTCPQLDDFSSYKFISVPTEAGALSFSCPLQISPPWSMPYRGPSELSLKSRPAG